MKPSLTTSLEDWLCWLQNQHNQEIHLGLDRVALVAGKMDLLQWHCPVITVAGTNGKGSSVAMLEAIYQAAGYRVGCYTSPHLIIFNERIKIAGQMVSDVQIAQAFYAINQARGTTFLSYFEFATLAALFLFKQSDLEVVLLEVGLGGRLDAVNMVDADAALLTAIDVDHVDWLGNDRSQIALEKAAIMRPNHLAVCSERYPPKSLEGYCKTQGIVLHQLGCSFDFRFESLVDLNHKTWSLLMDNEPCLENLPLPNLLGDFQVQNAAGVLCIIEGLQSRLPVTLAAIEQGLQSVKHPGRLHAIRACGQDWLFDVAHNPQSATVLADYLGCQKRVFDACIFSVLADKSAAPMIQRIKPFVKQWLIADLLQPRAMSLSDLTALLVSEGIEPNQIIPFDSVQQAVVYLSEEASRQRDLLVWGSFFTVSQAMESLNDG